MINETECNQLLETYYQLRDQANSPTATRKFKQHQNHCIQKLAYIVDYKLYKYKKFSNYEDIRQAGFESLILAINSFQLGKGSFFAWAHQYVSTAIFRNANKHSTIRYPMKVAKDQVPHKVEFTDGLVSILLGGGSGGSLSKTDRQRLAHFHTNEPLVCLHTGYEDYAQTEMFERLNKSINLLSMEEQSIIKNALGATQESPVSFCQNHNMSMISYKTRVKKIVKKIRKEINEEK